MAQKLRIAIVISTILTVSACSNLFTGNLFENFDGPPDASVLLDGYIDGSGNVSAADADDFVDDLLDAADSSRFYDDLSGSDRTELNTALKSVYDNDDVATTTRQEASILAGEILTRGTDAGDTINNVANVITSDDGADAFEDPSALLDLIIPESAQGDAEAIEAILTDLVSAGDAYDALGQTLTDGAPAPDDVNMTEVAQKAAVSIAVKNLSEQTSVSQLAADIAGGTVDTNSAYTDVNPIDDPNLESILEAGGLGDLIGS
ncbi:MAG: hypothetical protein ACLFSV_06550 [Alkalispirochaeta sp.]